MRHVEFTFEIIAATIDPCCVLDELTYQLAIQDTSIIRIAAYIWSAHAYTKITGLSVASLVSLRSNVYCTFSTLQG